MTFLRNRPLVALLTFGLMLAMTQFASAQRGRRGSLTTSRLQLATLEQVQAELKLDDDQTKLVEAVSQKLSEERRELFQGGGGGGGGFAAMREKMEKMNAAASAKLTEKLQDAQKQRLTQLYVQVNGAAVIGWVLTVDVGMGEPATSTPAP